VSSTTGVTYWESFGSVEESSEIVLTAPTAPASPASPRPHSRSCEVRTTPRSLSLEVPTVLRVGGRELVMRSCISGGAALELVVAVRFVGSMILEVSIMASRGCDVGESSQGSQGSRLRDKS
jgi:hypothetical protein